MGRRHETISFLSDYGNADEFAGVVRSVLRSLAPHASVVDITHEVAPHDVRGGGLTLMRSAQYLAPGIVLAVVDPGVGSDRRAVAVEVSGGDGIFVGPDNGLLAPAVSIVGGAERAVDLTNVDYQLPAPGPTFAGRDVFAPAAGHLASGVDLAELGPSIDPLTLLPGLVPITSATEEGGVRGEVLWVDRYGNAQLNVDPEDIAGFGDVLIVRWGDPSAGNVRRAARASTYADLKGGELGLVVDSYGLLSLAFDRRNAATELHLRAGDAVTLDPPS